MKYFQKSTNPSNTYFRKSIGGNNYFSKSSNKSNNKKHYHHYETEKDKVKRSPIERHHNGC